MKIILKTLLLLLIVNMLACRGSKESSNIPVFAPPTATLQDRYPVDKNAPPAIIYKTTGDFYDYVPVIMNNDRTEIISYPAPSVIYYAGKLAKPLKLKNGYLFDNRGINQNVAFLSYTYEEYGKLEKTPDLSELTTRIKEKYPLLEMYNCGARKQYNDDINNLNKLIDTNFRDCAKIK